MGMIQRIVIVVVWMGLETPRYYDNAPNLHCRGVRVIELKDCEVELWYQVNFVVTPTLSSNLTLCLTSSRGTVDHSPRGE